MQNLTLTIPIPTGSAPKAISVLSALADLMSSVVIAATDDAEKQSIASTLRAELTRATEQLRQPTTIALVGGSVQ